MAKPKFDYNSNEFYDEIFALAFRGLTDAEIADALSEKFGQTLASEVFSRMKNGCYEGWSNKENKIRSEKISQVLSRARRKINVLIRGAFLSAALGGKKVKSKSVVSRKLKRPDGTLMDMEDVQTTETETELPPNLQAITTWLNHHDEDWRKTTQEEEDNEEGSIDITNWIKDNSK